MSLPLPVRAVVFDMDGLLIDTEQVMWTCMCDASRAVGHEMPFATFQTMIGMNHVENDKVLAAHFGVGDLRAAFRAEMRSRVDRALGAGVCLKAGVIEILDRLDDLGLPRAVATSSRRDDVDRHLGPLGLIERFDAFVTGEAVTHSKPHPEPYLKAALALGVDPAVCLALEDSHNGVRAAASAGMMTIMVPDILEPTPEMGELCIRIARDLHEVRALLGEPA
jgi:HAD superfamily hydrolase (TIGR01509 family)